MTDDELEASSVKYNCDRIVRLSSGRFALFSHWQQDEGIPLVAIGTLADLGPQIQSVDEIHAMTPVELPHFDPDAALPGKGKVSLSLADLGLAKPKAPFKRRF